MNKEQARAELAQLEQRKLELQAILAKTEFDPKKFLLDIFSDFNYKVDRERFPNIQFFGFDKEGKYLFGYNDKDGYFGLSYSKTWNVLERKMGWNYPQIKEFSTSVVGEHFKLNGTTTGPVDIDVWLTVEEHFKLKGITTV